MWIVTTLLILSTLAGLMVLAFCVAGSRADRAMTRFQDELVLQKLSGHERDTPPRRPTWTGAPPETTPRTALTGQVTARAVSTAPPTTRLH